MIKVDFIIIIIIIINWIVLILRVRIFKKQLVFMVANSFSKEALIILMVLSNNWSNLQWHWEVKCEDMKVLCYSQVQFRVDRTLPSHLSALLKSVQVLLLGFSFMAIELDGKWFQQTVPLHCNFKGPWRDL